ncbi:MAG: YfhO family protein [Deltaproteobacteria bacterium]|nr:YfhO family protein [Deltaproteobacteria bacterium]
MAPAPSPEPRTALSARRAALVACACCAVLVVAQYAGAVLGGGVYHFEDAADGYYPGHEATRRALKDGTLPLWEPGSWSGWPAVVDPYNGVYYPPNVVYYLVGAAPGLGYSVALHALLAALGLLAFLRQRRLSWTAALVGALAYALSSFMVVRVRHVIFIQLAAWIPWILWAVDRWLQTRRPQALLWLAAFGALATLAGGLSLEVLAALPVLVYVGTRLVTTWRAAPVGTRGRQAGFDLAALGGAALIGLTLAAAQIWPSLAHLPESPRSLGTSYEFASTYAWPNLRYALTLLVPDLYGNNMRGRFFGVFNYWEMAGYYVGVTAWLLAPFAFLWRGEGQRRRVELAALGGLALVAIGAALGDAGPVHQALYYGLPLYATLRCPTRALYIVVLVVPILAAHGVEALLLQGRDGATVLVRRGRLVAGVALALLVATVGAVLLAGLPRVQEAARLGAVRLLAVALIAGAVLGLAALRVVAPRVAVIGLMLLGSADLLWQNAGYLKAEPPTYPAGMERYQALEWVRAQGPGARFVNDGHGPFRLHNVGMVYGLENASGYDSVAIWRYVNLLQILNHGRPYPHAKLKHDLAAAAITNFNSRLLDLLNVKYVITFKPLPAPRFRLAFRPEPKVKLAWAEKHWDARLHVYENTTALPRAFVVYETQQVSSAAAAAAALAGPGFDPGRVAILEPAPVPPPAAAPEGAPRLTPATVTRHERHRVVIEAETPRPGVLVVSEVYYPGWSVRVDGKAAPLLRADYAFRGVALEAGRHTVEMTYHNRAAWGGIWLSLAALTVLVLLAVWLRRRVPIRAAASDH